MTALMSRTMSGPYADAPYLGLTPAQFGAARWMNEIEFSRGKGYDLCQRVRMRLTSMVLLLAVSAGCGSMMGDMMGIDTRNYPTNGETIFRTGHDQAGAVVQDMSRSAMNMMVHSCQMCHGADGGGMMGTPSIRFRDLADARQHTVPYTEAALRSFLDDDVEPDGSKANTGVAWRMNLQDKDDLINFLKTL